MIISFVAHPVSCNKNVCTNCPIKFGLSLALQLTIGHKVRLVAFIKASLEIVPDEFPRSGLELSGLNWQNRGPPKCPNILYDTSMERNFLILLQNFVILNNI